MFARLRRPRRSARDRRSDRARIAALAGQDAAARRRAAAISSRSAPRTTPTRGSPRSRRRCAPSAKQRRGRRCSRRAGATPLKIGLGLAVLQQITGINAIIYYSDSIFAAAGFTTPAAQAAATTWAIGAVNVLATFIAIAYIDRLGRRPLLIAGPHRHGAEPRRRRPRVRSNSGKPGRRQRRGIITLVALVVFIISFAFSLGPVTWTVINEIYPGEVRGRAVAVATAVNWGAAFLVSEFFLTVVNAIGQAYTFWLFAAFCALGLVWVYVGVPETRRRSLEEIQASWSAS